MADIVRFRPDDRRAVDTLYRRIFGYDAANASQLRWRWQYEQNPNNPPDGAQIWLAREGPTVIGQYATMPVRLTVVGSEITGSWGMDVMVAPERQRQGIGEVLFRTWDRQVGASLGLGLSVSSQGLFRKLKWPDIEPVPCLAKPLTRRAFRRASWPMPLNRLVSALTFPYVRFVSRTKPLHAQIEPIRHFDDRFTELWGRVARSFDLAVVRDAAYLNWKFIEPPHVRYSVVALKRDETVGGYAVYRHVQEARSRVTILVDFLVDPSDVLGLETLLRWVDREARAADSDKIRVFAMHEGYRRTLKRAGYFDVKASLPFTAKVNAVPVPTSFYERTDRWHVTLGDSDQDRYSGRRLAAVEEFACR
ncbi:MAG TPA: GNAT family N-acetyltransferase [Vicinamibacterales bacterium]|jgi:GNAT superfamily N-acetyltransferase